MSGQFQLRTAGGAYALSVTSASACDVAVSANLLQEGEPASYIPELAAVDPDSFGICVATHDGHIYEIGDTRLPFTIQSVVLSFTPRRIQR